MYSRKILLAAASLAVASMTDAASAASGIDPRQPVARDRIFATLHLHHYHGLSDPYFFRGRYVVRTVAPSGRVALVEVNPQNGDLIGEILI